MFPDLEPNYDCAWRNNGKCAISSPKKGMPCQYPFATKANCPVSGAQEGDFCEKPWAYSFGDDSDELIWPE